ncbi:28S ribosomal protein S24, mitochondrial isoform X1 [Dermochelys coriacea]|uniref:28S ribosomal protein S24, mitochondrial isoform X1 n=1 Tax=Dermochelys coriacea TaxID=27794 RepID=UPI001CA9D89F|nr:28S ribosomal protein S24, mitochondrial isoform X1 [Dermochelys coriacea]
MPLCPESWQSKCPLHPGASPGSCQSPARSGKPPREHFVRTPRPQHRNGPLGVRGAGLAGGMRSTQRCPRLWSQPEGRYSNRLTLGRSMDQGRFLVAPSLQPGYSDHSCLSQGNLDGEGGAAERTVEDVFIRKFIYGTFHGCLANEIVLKRRANVLVICAVFLQRLPPYKFYFLVGYTETLLSFLYKCPVRLEVQTLPERVIYKYL